MDVMLWILIGLAAGLAIAAVAPEMGPRSLSQSGSRGVRDMAAGMIGAVAVAYALTRFAPALHVDGITTAFAALAGALWIAGVVEVYSSRRRAGEDTEQRQPERSGTPSAIELPAYDAAREALVAGLIEDALAHDAGRYAEIGRELPAVHRILSAKIRPPACRSHCASGAGGRRRATNDGAGTRPTNSSPWRTGRALRERLRLTWHSTATPGSRRSSPASADQAHDHPGMPEPNVQALRRVSEGR